MSTPDGLPVLTNAFKKYANPGRLAPKSREPFTARLWHLSHNTSAMAWWNFQGVQQVVYIPGHLTIPQFMSLARSSFGHKIPSPIVFRIKRKIRK